MERARWQTHAGLSRAIAILAVAANAAAAPDGFEVIGQIGGPTQGIAVQGGHAYAGVGTRLVVLDVSTPSAIREVGATLSFPRAVEDVALAGSLACVAAGRAGLRVVDVSNPALPTEVGAWDSTGSARGVTVSGTTAYVANGTHGLRLVDLSNPSQPVEIGVAYPTYYAVDAAVQGRYAYVAAGGSGLLIADVNDPRRPVEVGTLVTNGYAYGVAVAGNIVYLADAWEGVKVIDVTDPAHPAPVAALETPGWAFGVTVAGTSLYVADAFGGLRVLDVASAAHPVEIAHASVPAGHAGGVAVNGNTAFVADRNWGLRAIDLTKGPDLPEVGSYHPIGYADGVALSGNYAYVAEANTGFFAIDISDPARPRQVGSVSADGHSLDVVVQGPFAYMIAQGGAPAGLHVIDVSDPTRPARVGFHHIGDGQPRGLDVSGTFAYVAMETGLDIVNVSDAAHPVRSALLRTQVQYSDPEVCVGVTVQGNVAHVALERGGFATIDVSDPARPVRRGDFDPAPPSFIRDVVVSANRAYVGDTANGLLVLDVADPSHPVAIGSLRTIGPHTLTAAGTFAYLAVGDYGVIVVDVSDPTNPKAAGSYRTQGYTRQLAVAGGRMFLADGPGGLLILERTPGASTAFVESDATVRSLPVPLVPHPPPPSFEAAPPPSRSAREASAAAAGCVVTSASDSGAGTLRDCISRSVTGTTITFDPAVFPPAAPASIRLASGLPGLPGGVTIDGSDAGVIIDGHDAQANAGVVFGLFINSDANTIRGLQILRFSGTGIQILGSGNVIGGDRSVGRGPTGQGNVVSGNRDTGIMISGDGTGSTASGNIVVGNFVGTDATGTKAMGNGVDGVWVQKAANNRIGGPDPRDRNVVSGNGWSGIILAGQSTGNLVAGNYVGTDVTGSFAVGNLNRGIHMGTGAYGNVIQGNLVSGNPGWAVAIEDHGGSYNEVVGNRIGTDATGTRAIANGGHGVLLNAAVSGFNRIGGTRPEERNIVSGNLQGGIVVMTSGNLIRGNYVGTDVTGRSPLGNGDDGIRLSGGRNVVGGAAPGEANVIAANGGFGVSASGNSIDILGNTIGTDPGGQVAMGNARSGVTLGGRQSVVQNNVIAHTVRNAGFGTGSGISLGAEHDGTIRRNSIHDNAGAGIDAGAEPSAPVIVSATATTVSGTACQGCEVEIFSDSGDEGRVYEGSALADHSGAFVFTRTPSLTGPNVTATATDSAGRSSVFSAPASLPPKPERHRMVRR